MAPQILLALYLFLGLISLVKPLWFVRFVFVTAPVSFGIISSTSGMSTPLGIVNVSALKVAALFLLTLLGLLVSRANLFAGVARLWGFALFLTFAAFSLAWGEDVVMGVRMLSKLITPFAFALYVFGNLHRIGSDKLLWSLIWAGVFYAGVAGLYWMTNGFGAFTVPGLSRAEYSGFTVCGFGAVMALFAHRPSLLKGIIATLFVAAVLLAFTRITIAALFAVAGVVIFLRSGTVFRLLAPFVAMACLVLLFVTVDSFRERMFLHQADDVTVDAVLEDPVEVFGKIGGSGRFAAWEIALGRLHEPRPWTGSGIGATQLLFYGSARATRVSVVHSEIVRLLCDLGYLGLAIYGLAWLQVGLRTLRRGGGPLSLAALGAGVGYLTFLLTDNGFDYVAQIGVCVFALVGAAASAGVQSTSSRANRDALPLAPMNFVWKSSS